MRARALSSVLLCCSLAAAGCGTEDTRDVRPADTAPAAGAPGTTAEPAGAAELTAPLIDRTGQEIGTVRLTETGQGVQVAIEARGLPPGPRGLHFHETGRCDPPSFQSAGGHFAPMDRQHGLQNPQGPHAGDMENLTVGEDGSVNTTVSNPRVTLRDGQPNSLLDADGTALIVHAERDDQVTDPTGNSGDRIACAAFTRAGAN
jgi:superoxide dismutase, Cu-Zn family